MSKKDNEETSQFIVGKKAKGEPFPWDTLIFTPIWLAIAYVSVVFPHKTFQVSTLDVPMTPVLLIFASSVMFFAYFYVIDKETFGDALGISMLGHFLVFIPVPISWFLLSFYEVSTLPSFLSCLILPIIMLTSQLREWSKSRRGETSQKTTRGMFGLPKQFKLIVYYISGLFFGYATITSLSYFFCYLTNQSFEVFVKANPTIILAGGATIVAGILALARPAK